MADSELNSSSLGYGTVTGFCENGNEPTRFTKYRNFSINRATMSFSVGTLLYGVNSKTLYNPTEHELHRLR
jgi:hypothetical protein